MTDRIKEMLFENLGGELAGERVADVFSGTGTLGLEALSRGASRVVFVEKDHKAHALLHQNVSMLEVQPETFCWRTDVLRCSFKPKGKPEFLLYDLIFFDPPYEMVRNAHTNRLLHQAIQRLGKPDVSAPDAHMLVRIPKFAKLECSPLWRQKHLFDVSGMQIYWYVKSGDTGRVPAPSLQAPAVPAPHIEP